MLKRVYRKLERTVFMMAMLWAQEIMSCETTNVCPLPPPAEGEGESHSGEERL